MSNDQAPPLADAFNAALGFFEEERPNINHGIEALCGPDVANMHAAGAYILGTDFLAGDDDHDDDDDDDGGPPTPREDLPDVDEVFLIF